MRAKLARADHHLDLLYDEIGRWSDLNPCSISRESNTDGTEHVFRLHIAPRPDVWRWAVLMGDALFNLRCALDHIIYALAIVHTGQDPPDDDAKLAFPITSSPEKFKASQWRISSLPQLVQTGIEKAQPYNRTHRSGWQPLWWLAQLNDVDKHRLSILQPIAAVPDEVVIDAEPGSFRVLWNSSAYIDGTPVLVVRLKEPDPNVYVDLKMTGAVVIKVEDERPIGVVLSLRSIRREVGTLCRYMTRFFPRT